MTSGEAASARPPLVRLHWLLLSVLLLIFAIAVWLIPTSGGVPAPSPDDDAPGALAAADVMLGAANGPTAG